MGPDLRIDAVITAALTLAVLPLAMLPALGVVVRRYGRLQPWPLVCAVGLLASAAAVAAFTLFPLPEPGQITCVPGSMTDRWQLDPFDQLRRVGRVIDDRGLAEALSRYEARQAIENILLFVPFGCFLHQVTRWRPGAVIGAAAGTSLALEIAQGTGFFGMFACPYRQLDLGDVLLNTLGGALGLVLSRALTRAPFTNPVPLPDLDPPGRARRAVAVLVDVALVAGTALATASTLQAVLARSATLARAQERIGSPAVEIAIDLAAAALVTLLPCLLGRDRATPGELLLNLAPATTGTHATPGNGRIVRRWAARWLPWALVPALLPVVLIAEAVVALVRPDRRSLSAVASGTTTLTRRSLPARRSPVDDAGVPASERA